MIFGFGRKKGLLYSCPVCAREYEIRFDTRDIEQEHYEESEFKELYSKHAHVGNTQCEFCKAKLGLLYNPDGFVEAIDEKWYPEELKYQQATESLEEQIDDCEDALELIADGYKDEVKAEPAAISKKLGMLKKKLDKIEDAWEKKEQKYMERCNRWGEKWAEKLPE